MFASALALLGLITLLLPIPTRSNVHIHGRDLNQPLLESYDYIVVGCGISGLVVSNRLSELSDRYVNGVLILILTGQLLPTAPLLTATNTSLCNVHVVEI